MVWNVVSARGLMGGRKLSVCWFLSQKLSWLQYVLLVCNRSFNFLSLGSPLCLGTRVRRAIVLFCDANPLCAKFCLCIQRFFMPAVFPPAAVFYKLESPWLQSAVQGNTGELCRLWVVHNKYSPCKAANWEGYESSCSSPPGSNKCTCNKPASSACCSDSWFYYVRLCGLCALVAASACSAHCDSGFPPGTANNRPWLLQGLQMSRKRPPRQRLRSCQLSQSFGWHRKGTPNLCLITF